MAIEAYYAVLSAIFAPVLALPPALAETILAAMIVFIITVLYKYLVDQEQMREHKEQIKTMQQKIKELQKTNPAEANKMLGDVLGMTNKQMLMNLKPMLVTMAFVLVFLPWIASVFGGKSVVLLPFALPFFGSELGWIAWYLIVSIPLSLLFRKMLGVHM